MLQKGKEEPGLLRSCCRHAGAAACCLLGEKLVWEPRGTEG